MYDYELIVGDHGRRLLAFGKYAGRAGLVDFLHGLGKSKLQVTCFFFKSNKLSFWMLMNVFFEMFDSGYLSLGYSTPFLSLGSSYMYSSLAAAKAAAHDAKEVSVARGLPARHHERAD